MKIKDKILSETSEEVKQRVRDTANKLVMKQETLEETAENYVDSFEYGIAHPRRVCKNAFINGAKWQQERSYSEEDLRKAFIEGYNVCRCVTDNTDEAKECFNEWFEQFKKK